MSCAKTDEERLFYIRLAIDEKYSSRELERQFDAMRFERAAISERTLPLSAKSFASRLVILMSGLFYALTKMIR